MNPTRSIFGSMLVAGLAAGVAVCALWLQAQSSLQPTEPPQEAEASATESVVQDFAAWPRSIHTAPVPVARQPVQSPALDAPMQQQPAAPRPRVATPLAAPGIPTEHAEPIDICARYGGHRIDFMRGQHAMWRCVYQRRR